ncbi:MAG: lytic transglycosylase domain-containing protein, partial [Mycobacterium sp.]|nr:lytic transglycosylase domain-containing protein [Mycobacterium sp.]
MTARTIPTHAALLVVVALMLAGCSDTTAPSATPTQPSAGAQAPAPPPPTTVPPSPEPAQPRLASDPAQLVDDLVADELALRDASSSQAVVRAAARRQQVAYRVIGRHPEWDPITRPRIPPALLEVYDRNVDARRQLASMIKQPLPTVPAWRINPPPPTHELLDYYRQAESATGVGWDYLAAINLVETAFGRIEG